MMIVTTRGAGESVLQQLQVYSTGYKFPPYKYDPDESPGTVVGLTWRRNGQPVTSRRVLSPTLVSPIPPIPLPSSSSEAPPWLSTLLHCSRSR